MPVDYTDVVDDAQVEEVVAGPHGLLEGAQPGTVIAIHSTIHPRTPQKLAKLAEACQVGIVDATMSGGSAGARAGTLCYMVGGEASHIAKCRPVFEASAAHIIQVGPVGMGAATKLAQQVIICLNRLAAHEGMRLAEKSRCGHSRAPGGRPGHHRSKPLRGAVGR